MDPVFRAVPAKKYKDLPRLTVPVEEETGGKFKVKRIVERPIWEYVLGEAQIALFKAGVPIKKIQYDAVAQEYIRAGAIIFIFHVRHGGKDLYITVPPEPPGITLRPEQIADLKAANLWQPYTTS
jgi:hypothetical protein